MTTAQRHYVRVAAGWLAAWAVAVGLTTAGCLKLNVPDDAFILGAVITVAFIVGWCWRGCDYAWSKIEKAPSPEQLMALAHLPPPTFALSDPRSIVKDYWSATPATLTLKRRRAVKMEE